MQVGAVAGDSINMGHPSNSHQCGWHSSTMYIHVACDEHFGYRVACEAVTKLARAGFNIDGLPAGFGPAGATPATHSLDVVLTGAQQLADMCRTLYSSKLLAHVVELCHISKDHQLLIRLLGQWQGWSIGALQRAMHAAIDAHCQSCVALFCPTMRMLLNTRYQHEPALTPVMQACMHASHGMPALSALLAHGASANGVPHMHFPSSLWIAVMNYSEPVARLLLSHQADATVRSPKTGCTLLMMASALGDPSMVALLLQHAPSLLHMTDVHGWGPLMWAYHRARADKPKPHFQIVQQLRTAGAAELTPVQFGKANMKPRSQLDSAVAWGVLAVCANFGPDSPTNDNVVIPPDREVVWLYPQRLSRLAN